MRRKEIYFNIEVNSFYEQRFNSYVDVIIIIEAINEVLTSEIETTRLTRVN
jgi:hypothetical protein